MWAFKVLLDLSLATLVVYLSIWTYQRVKIQGSSTITYMSLSANSALCVRRDRNNLNRFLY